MRSRAFLLAVGLCAVRLARADAPAAGEPFVEEGPPADAAAAAAAETGGDPGFGPAITIERIEVEGNHRTAEKLVRRVLLVREGETLRAGDPRLTDSRFRVLALGYFRDVRLSLRKGSRRGQVVLTVCVVERGTLTLHQLFWGASEATPLWLGADLGDTNFLGSGLELGAAVVWAQAASLEGARDQVAVRLRYADPSVFGLPLGVHAGALYDDASEPYRVAGAPGDDAPANFRAFRYRRAGGVAGVSLDLTRLARLDLDLRWEEVDAELPDGVGELYLRPGRSRVAGLGAGLDLDNRPDPVLPWTGDHLVIWVDVADDHVGDYRYLRAFARYGRWFPLAGARHVLSAHAAAALSLGDTPRFDRPYVGDWDVLLPSRPLGLVVSTRAPVDVFDSGAGRTPYGEAAAAVGLEYSYRLFRRSRRIYGGDLFLGAGLFVFGSRADLAGLPLGLTVDAGLRLDTEIGIFELGLANALGRIPL